MDVDASTLVSCFLHKVNDIIKDALNSFAIMILQVIALILYSIGFEILIAIISYAVDDMSNTNSLEYLIVFGNDVTAQV